MAGAQKRVLYKGAYLWIGIAIVLHLVGMGIVYVPRYARSAKLIIDVGALNRADLAAIVIPLITVFCLWLIHRRDHGLKAESRAAGAPPATFVDSAINKQSIYSAIGLGA